MRFTEIQEIAKRRGLSTGSLKNKTDLVRAIQRAEGNFDCFGTAVDGICSQLHCLWRGDCLPPRVSETPEPIQPKVDTVKLEEPRAVAKPKPPARSKPVKAAPKPEKVPEIAKSAEPPVAAVTTPEKVATGAAKSVAAEKSQKATSPAKKTSKSTNGTKTSTPPKAS